MRIAAAAILAALVVSVGACGSGEEEPEELSDHLVVSIGDSVASGEGNPDRPATLFSEAGWKNRRCHRSAKSAHAIAVAEVLGAGLHGRLELLGCSGATIGRGLFGPYEGIEPTGEDEEPQVERLRALAGEHEIDAVLVSIGANDVGFSKIVEFCIFKAPCPEKDFDPKPKEPGPVGPLDDYVPTALEELADGYRDLDAALDEIVPSERVVIVEYFDPTSAPRDAPPRVAAGGDCKMFFGGVTPEESRWAREELLRPLNDQIAESAEELGWRLVGGVDERFEGHGICAEEESFVTTFRESVIGHGIPLGGNPLDRETHQQLLGSYKGTLHPNPAGHRATAELIAPVLGELVTPSE